MMIYIRKIGNLWKFDNFENFKICYLSSEIIKFKKF